MGMSDVELELCCTLHLCLHCESHKVPVMFIHWEHKQSFSNKMAIFTVLTTMCAGLYYIIENA